MLTMHEISFYTHKKARRRLSARRRPRSERVVDVNLNLIIHRSITSRFSLVDNRKTTKKAFPLKEEEVSVTPGASSPCCRARRCEDTEHCETRRRGSCSSRHACSRRRCSSGPQCAANSFGAEQASKRRTRRRSWRRWCRSRRSRRRG
jgi:hypothetical protein